MALRILVVDDQEPVRRAITSILRKRPDWHVCGEAADGVEAVARAKELRPDAILMDVSMPKMDGLIRTTYYLLPPPLLDENGLHSALHWYTQGLVERSGLEINLEISKDLGRLSRDMEFAVFRLAQEGLTNIHRHSGSKTASIRIASARSEVTVDIQDKGHGLSTERLGEIQSGGSGVGIAG